MPPLDFSKSPCKRPSYGSRQRRIRKENTDYRLIDLGMDVGLSEQRICDFELAKALPANKQVVINIARFLRCTPEQTEELVQAHYCDKDRLQGWVCLTCPCFPLLLAQYIGPGNSHP